MDIRKDIADNLAEIMRKKGVKNIDLARHLSVSKQAVTNWLKCVNGINVDYIPEICSYLGITTDEFFCAVEDESYEHIDMRGVEMKELFDELSDRDKDILIGIAKLIKCNGEETSC